MRIVINHIATIRNTFQEASYQSTSNDEEQARMYYDLEQMKRVFDYGIILCLQPKRHRQLACTESSSDGTMEFEPTQVASTRPAENLGSDETPRRKILKEAINSQNETQPTSLAGGKRSDFPCGRHCWCSSSLRGSHKHGSVDLMEAGSLRSKLKGGLNILPRFYHKVSIKGVSHSRALSCHENEY